MIQQARYIKSFSRGQITIPKEIREKMGVGEDFWLKVYVDDGKIVAEPVQANVDRADYLQKLLSMNTDWFSEDEFRTIEQELDNHAQKHSL